MDLFVDLRDFYAGKISADVNSIMDKFFSPLVIRLYKIMNWGNQLSDSYLAWLFKQMDNLQPFGDIPATTSGHLKLHAPITRNSGQHFARNRWTSPSWRHSFRHVAAHGIWR